MIIIKFKEINSISSLSTLLIELPDFSIVLDTPAEECKKRMNIRGRGMEEGVPLGYLQQLGEVYSQNYNKLGIKSIKKFFDISPSVTAEEIIALSESEFKEYNL